MLTCIHEIKYVFGGVAPSMYMSYSKLFHYKYIIAGIISFSQASHTMEYIALSISVPNFRTTLNRAIYWASKYFWWKDVEISNHYRGITKFTLAVDRAAEPAAALSRRARLREKNQPTTISVLWTSSSNVTTNVAIWVDHLWIHPQWIKIKFPWIKHLAHSKHSSGGIFPSKNFFGKISVKTWADEKKIAA